MDIWDELENIDDDWDDFNNPDVASVTREQEMYALVLHNFLQSLVVKDDIVTESFVSKNCLNAHYSKHCIAGDSSRISERNNVFYDFNNKDAYRVYGDDISSRIKSTSNVVASLLDDELVNKYFRKLFTGNFDICFTLSCGFKNDTGSIVLGIHSFSSAVTKNYKVANTIDVVVLTPRFKTISVYPVDAYFFETKINSIIRKYCKAKVKFSINTEEN